MYRIANVQQISDIAGYNGYLRGAFQMGHSLFRSYKYVWSCLLIIIIIIMLFAAQEIYTFSSIWTAASKRQVYTTS